MRRIVPVILALGLVGVSCGGSDEGSSSETTETTATTAESEPATTVAEPAATTTTSAATTTTADDAPASDIDPLSVMPQECIDILVEYVQALEPHLGGMNPNFLTQAEIEAISAEIDPIQADYDEAVAAADCPQTDLRADRDLLTVMLDITATEAPGALRMMEWVADLAGYYDDVPDISTGDCDTDMAAFQEAISSASGGPHELSMRQFIDLQNLARSLRETCENRLIEYTESAEYQEWAALGME